MPDRPTLPGPGEMTTQHVYDLRKVYADGPAATDQITRDLLRRLNEAAAQHGVRLTDGYDLSLHYDIGGTPLHGRVLVRVTAAVEPLQGEHIEKGQPCG